MNAMKSTVMTICALLFISLGLGALATRSDRVAAQSVKIEPGRKPTPKPATPTPTPRKPIVNRTPRAGAAERFSYLNRPENLKALFETIHHLIYVKKDARSAAALFSYLRPNEERVKKALRSDIHPKNLEIILDWYRGGGSTTVAGIIQLVKPEQTIVKVHGATTEEIARYRQGTMQQDMMLYSGFPGGAVLMATRYLRWGMTFYEVELLEPGKEHGVKYHLFYWDGKQWTMLGGVWKALE